MLAIGIILIGLGFIDLLTTDYGENRIFFYIVPGIIFSLIGCSNATSENQKRDHEKYKNGPVLEVSMSNINCQQYRYYEKTIYKCDGKVVSIK